MIPVSGIMVFPISSGISQRTGAFALDCDSCKNLLLTAKILAVYILCFHYEKLELSETDYGHTGL